MNDDNAPDAERQRWESAQQRSAMAGLASIMRGGNLVEESMRISNEFTDRQTGRFAAWFRSLLGR